MFEKLYKRSASGSIRTWHIEIIDAVMTRYSGQLNGVVTKHVDEYTEGKNIGRANETTPVEQALSEARAYWLKQKDNGYKTMTELGVDSESELNAVLPAANTDAQGNIKPMLAKAVDWDTQKFPCYIQPKLDGVRCLMIVKDGDIQFLSRSGKYYNTLQFIADSIFTDEDFVLDGEIYSHDITFQEIISAVKKQGVHTHKLRFRAYDMVDDDLPQNHRLTLLTEIVTTLASVYVQEVDTHLISSMDDATKWRDEWIAAGYEGAMLRSPKGLYRSGARSSDLRKVKIFDDAEFWCRELIVGKREEDVIALCQTQEGKLFKAKLEGDAAYKEQVQATFKPGPLTVKYFGLTDDGIPRFPIGKTFVKN